MHNVPSFVFWFVNICFLPFVCRTSVQKWKKIWFCYVHKWIGKKEMSAKISKCLCRNLLIGATTQIRAVYEDHKILVTFKRCITLSLLFLDSQHKIYIVLWLLLLWKHFSFDKSANKTKAFNLKVNCKELRLVFTHRVYLNTWDCLNKLILCTFIFMSIIILLSSL